jgi:putative hydrolase of the HAD superfamily
VCRAPLPALQPPSLPPMSRTYDALVVDDVGVLSGVRLDDAATMAEVVRTARGAGLRTGLLSNAGGCGRPDWPDLFDAVVLTELEAVRKPDPEAFRLVAQRLGVPPERCVHVDDLVANVRGAAAAGMTGVHHTSPARTIEELEILLEIPLGA